ncbi:MAG TPA: response regulator transcription factor [Candidatus Dormibacteraeota bacterium]|nr:response regulator transcription factor [Candidatus Dormibacteraeota bacterium]
MIRLLLVDDQPLVRAGLRMVFEPEADIQIVGEAGDGNQGVWLARDLRPDVVLMDIRMPGRDGIQATSAILGDQGAPGTRVIVLTTYDHDEYVYEALRAGASGFLLKDAPPEALVAAVRAVAAGDELLAPGLTRRLIAGFARHRRAPEPPPGLSELTDREMEVLRLVAQGLSNGEIAARLRVGEATVKTHVGHLLSKLELRDRVQAVVLAYEARVVEPSG